MAHWSSIFPDDWQAQRCDLLVTHVVAFHHTNGMPLPDDLVRGMGERLVVHEHHHDGLDSIGAWDAQGLRPIGVGLRRVTRIDPTTGEAAVVVSRELEDE